jgi:hypothetical protein
VGFRPVVRIVEQTWGSEKSKLIVVDCLAGSQSQWNDMPIAFVHLSCTQLLMMASAVLLSVYMGMRGL